MEKERSFDLGGALCGFSANSEQLFAKPAQDGDVTTVFEGFQSPFSLYPNVRFACSLDNPGLQLAASGLQFALGIMAMVNRQ